MLNSRLFSNKFCAPVTTYKNLGEPPLSLPPPNRVQTRGFLARKGGDLPVLGSWGVAWKLANTTLKQKESSGTLTKAGGRETKHSLLLEDRQIVYFTTGDHQDGHAAHSNNHHPNRVNTLPEAESKHAE